jgi:hypothetical protein
MGNSELTWSQSARIAMIKKGITTGELAEMVKRSRPYVSNIINGRVFSPATNKLISDILDIEYKGGGY